MEQFISSYLILFPDRQLCRLLADTVTTARRAGKPIGVADAWIATTARLYSVPLITHNAADFAAVSGLTVISEPGA